jgi:hypothetical protein
MINEMRAYRSLDSRNTDPYVHVPSGRVVVASNLPDGSLGVSTLQFGVNPSLPQESNSRLTEISDEISRVSKTGAHRVKLGGFLNEERSESGSFNNALGTYTFNSLADFEAGNAASFTRTVARRDRNARSVNAALYLADSWRQSPRLQLTYGARLESSTYPDAPPFNAALDSVFGGVRTDRFPSEIHISPRVGFTYTFARSNTGPSPGSIRGGIGEFRGRASSQLFASAADATGLMRFSRIQLRFLRHVTAPAKSSAISGATSRYSVLILVRPAPGEDRSDSTGALRSDTTFRSTPRSPEALH